MPITKQHVKKGAPLAAAVVALTTYGLVTFEGFEPVAKHEAIDPPSVITWCYGRTNYDDPTVPAGTRFSKDECKVALTQDIPKYAAPLQECIANFGGLPAHMQASLIMAGYNLGSARVCKTVAARINAGDMKGACDAMLVYVRANGQVLKGLQRRRAFEHDWCVQGG